jgi:hypothetical protein
VPTIWPSSGGKGFIGQANGSPATPIATVNADAVIDQNELADLRRVIDSLGDGDGRATGGEVDAFLEKQGLSKAAFKALHNALTFPDFKMEVSEAAPAGKAPEASRGGPTLKVQSAPQSGSPEITCKVTMPADQQGSFDINWPDGGEADTVPMQDAAVKIDGEGNVSVFLKGASQYVPVHDDQAKAILKAVLDAQAGSPAQQSNLEAVQAAAKKKLGT